MLHKSLVRTLWFSFFAFAMLVLVACQPAVAPASAPAATVVEEEVAQAPVDKTDEFEKALACVKEKFPASRYMTNEFLPDPEAPWVPMDCSGGVDKIRVGGPWINNDEPTPWYIAEDQGYYRGVCLEVEYIPGGPSVDHLQTLAGGATDVTIAAGGDGVFAMQLSTTPVDVRATGALLKHSPYIWLGIDEDTPKDQRSDKVVTEENLLAEVQGTTVGLQPNMAPQFLGYLRDRYGVEVNVIDAGFTPDPLLLGVADWYGAWVMNQTRLAEEQGFMNWYVVKFSEFGLDSYGDVVVFRGETVEENPDLVRRFMAATVAGTRFMLDHPEEAAAIAVRYATDVQLTEAQALRRFQLQEQMVRGEDEVPQQMDSDVWDRALAMYLAYGQLEVPGCE